MQSAFDEQGLFWFLLTGGTQHAVSYSPAHHFLNQWTLSGSVRVPRVLSKYSTLIFNR